MDHVGHVYVECNNTDSCCAADGPQQANLQLVSDDAVTFVDHSHKAVNISVFIILVNT